MPNAALASEASALNEPISGAPTNSTAAADAGSLATFESRSRQPRLRVSRISFDPPFCPHGRVELFQLFLRVAVRIDRNGKSTVTVEFEAHAGHSFPNLSRFPRIAP